MDFSFLDDAIKKRECITYTDTEPKINDNVFHIAYGIDANFVRPMGVAMTSIVENNQESEFVFHVLTDGLDDEGKASLREFAKQYKQHIFLYYINSIVFDRLPSTAHFTKATYNRFLLPKALAEIAKRVIYLDADILCLANFTDLLNLDFKDKVVSVVHDIDAVAKRQIRSLGLKENQYFNAGFLYIDIEAWNREHISEKALEVSFARLGQLDWLDQDALNIVLEGKVQYIDQKYDYIFDLGGNKSIENLPQNTVFVHYAGRFKPWHEWCMHPLKDDFIHYAVLSPWADVPLVHPQSYKDMKKMAKSYFYYNKIIDGLLWYAKYSLYKIKAKIGM